MTFSEYAVGLSPYISGGLSECDFFTELVGNFIKDAAMDSCKILKQKPDTKYRYIVGHRQITPGNAQYLYSHRDTEKFSSWVWGRMDESDSYDEVSAWLEIQHIKNEDPSVGCAELLSSILLEIIAGSPDSDRNSRNTNANPRSCESDLKLIEEIREKIKKLPRPASISVPKEATNDEQTYIAELYRAYGDAEGIDSFSRDDLDSFPEYEDDLEDRRIDFYAAESIRRGVQELGGSGIEDQFDVLKEETLNGIKDTARRTHSNGYEHMLAVMEQAVAVPVTEYLLSSSPYWISGKIKKGVCHHLVNDDKLLWVRRTKT